MVRWFITSSIVVLLTGCGVLPSSEGTPTATETISPAKETKQLNEQLIIEAERGNVDKLLQLIKDGADKNTTDSRERTPMMAAVHAGEVEAFKALIEAGADINIRDARSDNPLLYASAEGNLAIVKLAIEAGADTKLTNRFGGTSLIPAADRGHVEIVETLLTTSDVNIDHINNLGWTALLEAVILGDGGEKHQQIVELLIQHKANVNIADKDGVTPLQHAISRNYSEMIRMLKLAGAK
ncbi:ankyrin repeat domain-containing protein [Paenibacillus sp. N1-5-1-14]|uniref:ankyrin repeat domain-containing protein n=1 Tax=Paenibacillus radicibacter TaxID=2972488 RepID=UPI002158E774|nr:ankyrin repeat domain-containing protein [Paenibacillus radicibacter]MCR8643617.1 ankyrin repeat domain-containing protein [Paenibacillus radicibacter]